MNFSLSLTLTYSSKLFGMNDTHIPYSLGFPEVPVCVYESGFSPLEPKNVKYENNKHAK